MFHRPVKKHPPQESTTIARAVGRSHQSIRRRGRCKFYEYSRRTNNTAAGKTNSPVRAAPRRVDHDPPHPRPSAANTTETNETQTQQPIAGAARITDGQGSRGAGARRPSRTTSSTRPARTSTAPPSSGPSTR